MTQLLPVFLAGGSGTRLWPLSREQYPKQFLKLLGERTLLQDTALRVQGYDHVLPPLAICGDRHRFIVAEQLLDAGISGATVMLEPEGRNTAPAAAVAAHYAVEKYGADVILLLMPSDHVVAEPECFRQAVQLAQKSATTGRIVAFGIQPTRAETGFGYIKAGAELATGVREIATFVEKPNAARAQAFIKDGSYYWNGGIFVFQAAAFLDELQKLEPQMHSATAAAVHKSRRDLDFIRLDAESFKIRKSTRLNSSHRV